MSSYTQENLQKILALSMTNSFSRLIEKGNLKLAEKKFDIGTASDIGHIMFTISGLEFRALVMLHYQAGKSAMRFLNLFEGDEKTTRQESNLESFYTELGNQFCGEIKRNLYKQFYHLGMSTPSLLSPATSLIDIENSLLFDASNTRKASIFGEIFCFLFFFILKKIFVLIQIKHRFETRI